jgi:hypothetical protein
MDQLTKTKLTFKYTPFHPKIVQSILTNVRVSTAFFFSDIFWQVFINLEFASSKC